MRILIRLLRYALYLALAGALIGVLALGTAYWLIAPRLPSVETLKDVRLQVPLRIYSADDKLIATFGETKRTPVRIQDVPEQLKQAFLAAEDADFYTHSGIDIGGIFRAVWLVATTGSKHVAGGSTITQQVARNFFLSPEVSYTRKLSEIFLAFRIENALTKDEILELYLNKIFLGHRSYGVSAAAEFYYGKTLDQLTIPECAMLASLPKFPSTGNPISNPSRAIERRNYVLGRMLDNRFIDKPTYEKSIAEPDQAFAHEPPVEVDAPYFAEVQDIEGVVAWMGNGAWERFTGPVSRLARSVPEPVLMGYHLCYGTFPDWPMYEARDLALLVKMVNHAIENSGRPVDWVHLAGPKYLRSEDERFFAPLTDLQTNDTRVFLGIVLPLDGIPGLKRRHATASRFLKDFGVAMYCGFGRQPGQNGIETMREHRSVVESL